MAALSEMPHTQSSEQKRERFLTALALKRDVAARTQNQACLRRKAERRGRQAFNAIAFFYKDVLSAPLHAVDALPATRPVHLRHVPTLSETRVLLQAVCDLADNVILYGQRVLNRHPIR